MHTYVTPKHEDSEALQAAGLLQSMENSAATHFAVQASGKHISQHAHCAAAGLGVKPRAGVGCVAARHRAVGDGVLRAPGAEIGAEWLLSCLLLLCRAKPGSSHRNPAGCGQWYRGAVRAPARLLQNQQLPSLPIVNSVEVWEQLTSDRHLHDAELLPGCLGNSHKLLCNMLPSCHIPGPCCALPRERIPAAVGPAAQ